MQSVNPNTPASASQPPLQGGAAHAPADQQPSLPTSTSAGTGVLSRSAGGAARAWVMQSMSNALPDALPTLAQLHAAIDANDAIKPAEKEAVKQWTADWLKQDGTMAALKQQALEKQQNAMPLADLQPGDIMVRKEFPPESHAHAFSLNKQMQPNVNGLAENAGDANCFHIMLASHTPGNALAMSADDDAEGKQVEARGGLGTTNTMRVQTSAVQAGSYWIYRPTDKTMGDFAAQAALMWKDTPYSKSTLGASMRPGEFHRAFSDDAQAQIAAIAEDGFTNSPAQGKQSNEALFNTTHRSPKPWDRGDMCSSLAVRAYQASAVHIMNANRPQDPEKAAMYVPELTGMMRNNAEGMSPRTLEHFCRTGQDADGQKQFGFVGVVTVKPEQVAYPERRYDAETGKPLVS